MNAKLVLATKSGKRYLLCHSNRVKKTGVKKQGTPANNQRKNSIKSIALLGVFCALAYIFTLLGNLIPVSVAGFLSYDPKDIIVAIAGFILGPAYAIAISVVVAILELITISSTGIIGCIMNIISTASFAGIASLIYKKKRSASGAIFGLILSSLCTTALMILWNAFVTPYYMHVPREAIYDMLLPVFLPFNLIKSGINASITILIYKPVVKALRRARLVAPSGSTKKARSSLAISLVSLFVLATLVFCFLIIAKVI
ncbi:MAG: ECF transporter S component [Clostridia bacterium]|nr:ECF transporter S component [Clostridia bacterium]